MLAGKSSPQTLILHNRNIFAFQLYLRRVNGSEIIQISPNRQNFSWRATFYVYLFTPAILVNFVRLKFISEAAVDRCSVKKLFWKLSQKSRGKTSAGTSYQKIYRLKRSKVVKRDSGTCFFSVNFSKHFGNQFCRAPLGDCFFHLKGVADFLSSWIKFHNSLWKAFTSLLRS